MPDTISLELLDEPQNTKIDPHKNYLLVSFLVTNEDALAILQSQWKKQRQTVEGRFQGRDQKTTETLSSDNMGGAVMLVPMPDHNNTQQGTISPVFNLNLGVPMGASIDNNDILYIAGEHYVHRVQNGKILSPLSHPLFCGVHDVSVTQQQTLLVTSTSIDAILEFSTGSNPQLLWTWFGTENGYDKTPLGKTRTLDQDANYQDKDFATIEQTTHVNSSLDYGDDKILATLFHQGQLILIDKKTGASEVVVDGLSHPHGIHKNGDGYILSDTKNAMIIELDKNLKIIRKEKGDFSWVQDAWHYNGEYIVANSNQGCIDICDVDMNKIYSLHYGATKKRIGAIMPLKGHEALKFWPS